MEYKGNYNLHAAVWDWGGIDRTDEFEFWRLRAEQYGKNVLIPFCALGEAGAYLAKRSFSVTAFDISPEMISEGQKRFNDISGLRLFVGDVTNFRFDIPTADFCYALDFGHLHSIEEIKSALVNINYHLRDGGGLVIEDNLPVNDSYTSPIETFYPKMQIYPDKKVWKTSKTHFDAETSRRYISQTIYIEEESGSIRQFDHSFYLQCYKRDDWLSALAECGFEVKGEYRDHEMNIWRENDTVWICEAVKPLTLKERYCPQINLDYLRTPIFKFENVSLYNDVINLEQPNTGLSQFYRFDINADGDWVGWITVKLGYSIRDYYNGQIGYVIYDQFMNRGYATKACFALIPF